MNLVLGVHPVETLLNTSPERVRAIFYIPKKSPSPKTMRLIEKAQANHIPVTAVSLGEAPSGKIPHQGIWARVAPFSYTTLIQWLQLQKECVISTLVILDGITDPHNLGAIIRTAACLGCQGILLPKNRSASITPTIWKTSSGAVGTLPILRETNLARSVERLKDEGFWILGTRAENALPPWNTPWPKKVAIIMGSEEKGIRPLLSSHCDLHLSIPLTGPVTSLNVSVAAGIILYERARYLAARPGEGEDHD